MLQRIGFTQGAFDMFHIGHLNLLRNARKHCDYLVVGVNSDELIANYKNKNTIVPFEERIAIVSAIKYVDEAIRMDTLDKLSVWNRYHFNLLLIGDDWKGSKRWKKTEKNMKTYGVDVIYLPYTKSTSSTIIREKLLAY